MIRVLFGAVICLLVAFAAADCPPKAELTPCYCNGHYNPIIVVCKNITDADVIRDVFKKILDYPVNMLTIADSTLQYIPASVVEQKELTHVQAVRSKLTSFFDVAPTKAKKLQQVMVVQNTTIQRGIVFEQWKELTALEEMIVHNVKIRKIGRSFVDNVPVSLKKIIFSNVKTKTIAEDAFTKLENLEIIVLTHTEFKNIKRTMFAKDSKLKTFDLSHSKFDSLPDDIFTNMPNLKNVYFYGSQLTLFSKTVFGYAWKNTLEWVGLDDNPLVCDCRIKWFIGQNERDIELHGACALPSGLNGTELKDLTQRDFQYCPK